MSFLCVFCLHDTRGQYLVQSKGFACYACILNNTCIFTYLIFLVFRFPTGRRSLPLQSVPPGPQTNVASRPLSDGAASNSTASPSAKLRKPSIRITVCTYTAKAFSLCDIYQQKFTEVPHVDLYFYSEKATRR